MMRCELTDNLELFCLRRYAVRALMKSGDAVEGRATDLRWNEARQECLLLTADGEEWLLPLDELARLSVLDASAPVRTLLF